MIFIPKILKRHNSVRTVDGVRVLVSISLVMKNKRYM